MRLISLQPVWANFEDYLKSLSGLTPIQRQEVMFRHEQCQLHEPDSPWCINNPLPETVLWEQPEYSDNHRGNH